MLILLSYIYTAAYSITYQIDKKILDLPSMRWWKGDEANTARGHDNTLRILQEMFPENNIVSINNWMIVNAKIKVTGITKDGVSGESIYAIQIGDKYSEEEDAAKTEAKIIYNIYWYDIYKYIPAKDNDYVLPKVNDEWNAYMIISCKESGKIWTDIQFYLDSITDNREEAENILKDKDIQNIEFRYGEDNNWGIADTVEDIKSILDWAKDPVGSIKYVLAGIVRGLGDICQILANIILLQINILK